MACDKLLCALPTAFVALAVAACGSSSRWSGSSSRTISEEISHAACMRSHGVPSFPDSGLDLQSSVDVRSRAFLAAANACAGLLATVNASRAPITQSIKTQLLTMAKCMRADGVPNLPDPTFHDDVVNLGAGGFDRQAPAFTHAAAICHFPVPKFPTLGETTP